MTDTLHLGVSLFPDHVDWPTLRDTARLLDEWGYDSIWIWDHFVPLRGDTDGPNLECWEVLAALGAVTKRVQLGALVTSVTYRHPALLAKMVATLDHVTHGRAIMGLGAGWHEREHRMYGLPFDTAGVRLAKMDEAARIIRSLLDEPRTTFGGNHYALADAVAEPKPVQRRLPILIGGGGERKTLRTTAKYADLWHGFGSPQQIAHKIEVLRAHCADVGRDPSEIEITCGPQPPFVIRDDPADVDPWRMTVARTAGTREIAVGPKPLHRVEDVAERLAEYWRVGVRGFIFGQGAPYDRETLERIAREVRPRLERLVGIASAA